MAAPRKKRNKEILKNSKVFKWTPARRKAAEMLSTGLYTFEQIQTELRITTPTLWEWKLNTIFLDEVDRLTLEIRAINRAGRIREALHGLEMKRHNISVDRDTFLDYLEFLTKISPTDTKSSDDKLKALIDAIMLGSRKS